MVQSLLARLPQDKQDIIEGMLKQDAIAYCQCGEMPTMVYGLHLDNDTVHMAEPDKTVAEKLTHFDVAEQKLLKWKFAVAYCQQIVAGHLNNTHVPSPRKIKAWADLNHKTLVDHCQDHVAYWKGRG